MAESATNEGPKASTELEVTVLEDLRALQRLVSAKQIANADVRQASALVRRLLIYRDLMKVANGRIGRLRLQAPDNQGFFRLTRNDPTVALVLSGGAIAFGVFARAMMLNRGPSASPAEGGPDDVATLSVESWLRQGVIYMKPLQIDPEKPPEGRWVK